MATVVNKHKWRSGDKKATVPGITATLTSKGQLTVPQPVREALGLRTGDKVTFIEDNGGYRIRAAFDPTVFDKYRGILKLGKTTDEIIEEMRGPVDLD